MWSAVIDALFGCSHRRTSFPLTLRRQISRYTGVRETYVVCLDCGAEFAYDWEHMRIQKPVRVAIPTMVRETPAAKVDG